MDQTAATSHTQPSKMRDDTIQVGANLLLKVPNGDVRPMKVEENGTINLGKFGAFYASELVGQPYGLTYEIVDKRLKVVPPRSMQEVEDTDATNELINDGQFVQPLTLEEIEDLKKSGLHAEEIIKRQIEQHVNYQLKTEYSKEKYKKRKEAKYSKSFTVVEPTLFNVCDYWFKKDQNRLRDIRPDALSQMLNLANIRPGGRYLAVDDASGVVVAGILERLGGSGRLITICDVDSPPAYPVTVQMNFRKEVVAPVMLSLNWATADEDYMPILPPSEASGQIKDSQKSRLNKRKAVANSLMQTREELFAGEFDGLLIASEYEPYSILDKLSPYLAGSANIVIHSPFVQTVTDLQTRLRELPQYLGPAVSEVWTRQYQVLPGRTHPTMNTSGSGGFILHAIKVYDDPKASSVAAHRHKAKKVRLEEESPAPGASGDVTPSNPATPMEMDTLPVSNTNADAEGQADVKLELSS